MTHRWSDESIQILNLSKSRNATRSKSLKSSIHYVNDVKAQCSQQSFKVVVLRKVTPEIVI